MTFATLIRRSLRFHARAHLGVVLGAAIGSAALIGALLVGDSVRESLRQRALARLDGTYFALAPQDRFFDRNLDERLTPGLWSFRGPGGSNQTMVIQLFDHQQALLLAGTAQT